MGGHIHDGVRQRLQPGFPDSDRRVRGRQRRRDLDRRRLGIDRLARRRRPPAASRRQRRDRGRRETASPTIR